MTDPITNIPSFWNIRCYLIKFFIHAGLTVRAKWPLKCKEFLFFTSLHQKLYLKNHFHFVKLIMKLRLLLIFTCLLVGLSHASAQVLQNWMNPDITQAWSQGYKGAGTTITFVDDFSTASSAKFSGNMNGATQNQAHGYWTSEQSSLVAPSATIHTVDYNTTSNQAVPLTKLGLNVVNLSYALYIPTASFNTNISLGAEQTSLINDAKNGTAVISKAAGNDGIPMTFTSGRTVGVYGSANGLDVMNYFLRGTQSGIYVGALSSNGSTSKPASMAYYSNTPGTDSVVQSHFLVVGVNSSQMGGLAGTSFAAPIISGYAAILGSKFSAATPTAITNDLLNTARTDTLKNYSASIYGKGEASLSRALAPASIH